MKSLLIAVAGFAMMAAAGAHAADRFDIAITVDDLPDHGSQTPGLPRIDIAHNYINALKAHQVPQAWGFVNAVGIQREPGSEAVLKAWRDAGFPLGNHTYSHPNVNSGTVEAFEAEIEADESTLKTYMGDNNYRYLRFPFLSAGDAAHHDAVNAWLKAHNYRIADVSVSFDDWAYTETYNRCLAKNDQASIAILKTRYLAGVDAGIVRMKSLSQAVYGRMIPQVLLTHIGGFASIMLPEVLNRLDAAGAHYVTLEQAESDAAYAETDPKAGDGAMMERTAYETGKDISKVPAGPNNAGIDAMCK
ncbi:polysaccharide deacetylase family protein [Asticcacaulis solisilvae]|uniref:polysaccharide deacetylase family protein n=1 Tax=Asticcacaulis solisilvae TaxID=1217274 RepID=UPI003FD6F5F3